jgi:hypothetical protein
VSRFIEGIRDYSPDLLPLLRRHEQGVQSLRRHDCIRERIYRVGRVVHDAALIVPWEAVAQLRAQFIEQPGGIHPAMISPSGRAADLSLVPVKRRSGLRLRVDLSPFVPRDRIFDVAEFGTGEAVVDVIVEGADVAQADGRHRRS